MAVLHFLSLSLCIPSVLSTALSSHFQVKGTDSALKIVTYDKYPVSGKWGCALKCQRNMFCLSFNLILNAGNWSCEENFERVDVSGVWFTPVEGSLYYERKSDPYSPYVDVTSAGYDPVDNELYVACRNVLFQFTDIANMQQVGPTTSVKLTISIMTLRFLPESPADEAWFYVYDDDDRVWKMTFTRGQFRATVNFTVAGTIATVHGQALNVTDIITYDGISYMISNDEIFLLGGGLEVKNVALLRTTVSWNVFKNTPTDLTAATEVDSSDVFFFRGNRFFRFDVALSKVTSAGIFQYKLP